MSFQNLVRLSQMKKKCPCLIMPMSKSVKKIELLLKKLQLMSYNMMIGYEYNICDHFTMEHFRLRQSMILTTSFFA
jgi:hypothetical protein